MSLALLHRTRDVKPVAPKIAELRPLTRAQLKAKQRKAKERFLRARKAEDQYRRQLKRLAQQVGHVVGGLAPEGELNATNQAEIQDALDRYATLTKPWAKAVAARMLADVDARDAKAWHEHSAELGAGLRQEIRTAPTGKAMRELLDLQVDLITSIPRSAAERVHRLATEALVTGRRAEHIRDDVLRSGKVAVHHAETIARTEVARAATTLTQARSQHIGATQYIWRTSNDGNVRELHQKLNGKVFSWTEPPIAGDKGERANPGCIYNCRCWAEPIIPDDL